MALFEEKAGTKAKAEGSTNKTTDRIINKVRVRAARAAQAWMKEQFGSYTRGFETDYDENKVDRWVGNLLDGIFEKAVLNAVGMERAGFDRGYTVKYDSILLRKMKEVAQAQADSLLQKFVEKHAKTLPGALPKKYLSAVEKAFESAYIDALENAAAQVAQRKAKEDVDKVLKDILRLPEKIYEELKEDGTI